MDNKKNFKQKINEVEVKVAHMKNKKMSKKRKIRSFKKNNIIDIYIYIN